MLSPESMIHRQKKQLRRGQLYGGIKGSWQQGTDVDAPHIDALEPVSLLGMPAGSSFPLCNLINVGQ